MNPGDIDLVLCDAGERRSLGMASQAAFLKMCADDPEFLPFHVSQGRKKTAVSEHWRHGQVKRLTGGRAARVSEVTQRDFDDVLAGFALMAGQPAKAFTLYMGTGKNRSGHNKTTVRRWIGIAISTGKKLGYNEKWIRGFCERWAPSLEECSPAQLRSCVVTMRSRYYKAKSAAAQAAGEPETAP